MTADVRLAADAFSARDVQLTLAPTGLLCRHGRGIKRRWVPTRGEAAQWWGLPTWAEPQVRAMVEEAGFSQISLSHSRNNLFVAAVKH